VHVVALDQRGPLEPDQGGKPPRIVKRLGIIDDSLPQILVGFGAGRIEGDHLRFHLTLGEGRDQIEGCLYRCITAFGECLDPARRLFEGQQLRFAGGDIAKESHPVGMVGHHQPVQWARQTHCLTGGGDDFLTARKAVSLARRKAVAEQACVH
jgi:hypothetical protein